MTTRKTSTEDPKLSVADFAWVAAVLEIKANLTKKTHATRKTPQLSLYIDTKQIEIIDYLCSITGQRIEAHTPRPLTKFDRRSCDIHCPTPHVHVNDEDNRKERQPTKRWTISGGSIVVVLYNTTPYMTPAGQDKFNEILIDAKANVPINGQGSGMVKTGIRRLALLGWDLPIDYLVAME